MSSNDTIKHKVAPEKFTCAQHVFASAKCHEVGIPKELSAARIFGEYRVYLNIYFPKELSNIIREYGEEIYVLLHENKLRKKLTYSIVAKFIDFESILSVATFISRSVDAIAIRTYVRDSYVEFEDAFQIFYENGYTTGLFTSSEKLLNFFAYSDLMNQTYKIININDPFLQYIKEKIIDCIEYTTYYKCENYQNI